MDSWPHVVGSLTASDRTAPHEERCRERAFPVLITVDEAADLLRTSRRAIYMMLERHQLCVRQSDWNGQLGTPKSGRLRYVPLTQRLTAALVEHRHLRSKRVLCQADGSPFTRQIVQNRMNLAARRGR